MGKNKKRRLKSHLKDRQKRGFTIIEVLIVLAIVGFIITIVFLTVSAAQRARRNFQRRKDVAMLLAAVAEYNSIYRRLPNSCNNTDPSCFVTGVDLTYYNNSSDPSVPNYVSFYNRTTPYNAGDDPHLDPNNSYSRERVSIRTFAKCENFELTGNGARRNNYAAEIVIETVKGGVVLCIEGA
jgi:prepilin-type N-terminal cleavage/methylation domain-containing protein